MSETRIGPLSGYRPAGSPRNGLPGERPYQYRGTPGWDPARGVHRDPGEVAPPMRSGGAWPGGKAARVAAYSQARDSGLTRAQAAARVGISRETAGKYERLYLGGGAP